MQFMLIHAKHSVDKNLLKMRKLWMEYKIWCLQKYFSLCKNVYTRCLWFSSMEIFSYRRSVFLLFVHPYSTLHICYHFWKAIYGKKKAVQCQKVFDRMEHSANNIFNHRNSSDLFGSIKSIQPHATKGCSLPYWTLYSTSGILVDAVHVFKISRIWWHIFPDRKKETSHIPSLVPSYNGYVVGFPWMVNISSSLSIFYFHELFNP